MNRKLKWKHSLKTEEYLHRGILSVPVRAFDTQKQPHSGSCADFEKFPVGKIIVG